MEGRAGKWFRGKGLGAARWVDFITAPEFVRLHVNELPVHPAEVEKPKWKYWLRS